MTHDLKTWSIYFLRVVEGSKTFEVRKSDRDFQVGDKLRLQEYDPEEKKYSGGELTLTITYILEGGQFGIEEGYVIMGFTNPNLN